MNSTGQRTGCAGAPRRRLHAADGRGFRYSSSRQHTAFYLPICLHPIRQHSGGHAPSSFRRRFVPFKPSPPVILHGLLPHRLDAHFLQLLNAALFWFCLPSTTAHARSAVRCCEHRHSPKTRPQSLSPRTRAADDETGSRDILFAAYTENHLFSLRHHRTPHTRTHTPATPRPTLLHRPHTRTRGTGRIFARRRRYSPLILLRTYRTCLPLWRTCILDKFTLPRHGCTAHHPAFPPHYRSTRRRRGAAWPRAVHHARRLRRYTSLLPRSWHFPLPPAAVDIGPVGISRVQRACIQRYRGDKAAKAIVERGSPSFLRLPPLHARRTPRTPRTCTLHLFPLITGCLCYSHVLTWVVLPGPHTPPHHIWTTYR